MKNENKDRRYLKLRKRVVALMCNLKRLPKKRTLGKNRLVWSKTKGGMSIFLNDPISRLYREIAKDKATAELLGGQFLEPTAAEIAEYEAAHPPIEQPEFVTCPDCKGEKRVIGNTAFTCYTCHGTGVVAAHTHMEVK